MKSNHLEETKIKAVKELDDRYELSAWERGLIADGFARGYNAGLERAVQLISEKE